MNTQTQPFMLYQLILTLLLESQSPLLQERMAYNNPTHIHNLLDTIHDGDDDGEKQTTTPTTTMRSAHRFLATLEPSSTEDM